MAMFVWWYSLCVFVRWFGVSMFACSLLCVCLFVCLFGCFLMCPLLSLRGVPALHAQERNDILIATPPLPTQEQLDHDDELFEQVIKELHDDGGSRDDMKPTSKP